MTRQSWDPIWDHVFSSQEWGKYPAESLIQFVARNFYKKDRSSIKILEVGCGTAANLWYISREGFDAYGIDGSKTAIEIGRKRLELEGLNAALQIGDISQLPYEDNFFDAVIDIECLYANSTDNLKFILKEIRRVLKPGGLLFSRTFSDKLYIGEGNKEVAQLEYESVTAGPLHGKGYIRLSNEEMIRENYGAFFKITELDVLDYTIRNQTVKISEYIIVAGKD